MVVVAPRDRAADRFFSPVSTPRTSEMIVDQIREVLRQGKLKTGDRLPNERELCETFGVSRVTVREALRVLEASGLVEIRVGGRGGAFVSEPSAERVSAELADLIQLSQLTAVDVTEARMVIELGLVPLAVARATDDDIADLLAMCRAQATALASGDYTASLSASFHQRVAECTHNAALLTLVRSFRGPMIASLEQAQRLAPEMGERGVREHLQFVRAMERRDSESALRIMTRHLRRTARRVAGTA